MIETLIAGPAKEPGLAHGQGLGPQPGQGLGSTQGQGLRSTQGPGLGSTQGPGLGLGHPVGSLRLEIEKIRTRIRELEER